MLKQVMMMGALALTVAFGATTAEAACVVSGGCHTLYAGQHIDAGTVCVEVVGDDLVITYNTNGDWVINETHTWVGDSAAKYPQTKQGNPVPGQFPYKSGGLGGETTHTVTIPLALLGFSCELESPDSIYYLAAHAALSNGGQTETGWSEGSRFVSKGNWGTYSNFTLSCDCGNPQYETVCETAFAMGGACFLDLDLDGDTFNRWGWTVGPLSPGAYDFPIYAAAGQCDISKGVEVGSLHVLYSEDGVVDVYFLMYEGFGLEETHLYVGNDVLATNNSGSYTVAPGQYPRKHSDLNGSNADNYLDWSGISGDIYVVAHAVVCWEE